VPVYETAWGKVDLSVRAIGDRSYVVEWRGGGSREVKASLIGSNRLLLTLKERTVVAHVARNEKEIDVFLEGRTFRFRPPSVERGGGMPEVPSLTAPMPGVVVKVLVSEDEEVQAGQAVVVVEAMKMIHEICSSGTGVVRRIHFREGDQVDAGVPIVEIDTGG
jgi:3-methylcrotonyl-CoA carboxylase alpha subunit